MAHSVTLAPTSVTVTPGGPAQTIDVSISGVPDDSSGTGSVTIDVGGESVVVNFNVTVDRPEPIASVTVSDPAVSATISTPQQDSADPTLWTCQVTVSA